MSDERKLTEPLSAGKYDTVQPTERPPLERPTPPFQVVEIVNQPSPSANLAREVIELLGVTV